MLSVFKKRQTLGLYSKAFKFRSMLKKRLVEIAVLLATDTLEPFPPAEMKKAFYSPNFIVPK